MPGAARCPAADRGHAQMLESVSPAPARGPAAPAREPGGAAVPRWAVAATLGAILAIAAFLRFVDLAVNPGGLYTDEATEAYDALRLLHVPGFHPVFLADGGGREALFAYAVAGVFRLAGETVLALRATAAGFGVAGVAATWLLARRFGTLAGLAGAGWAAGSLWLICVSRDGMRNAMVPLFGALALLALLEWERRRSGRSAALAGAMAALAALYTYQPLKLIPLLVLLWLLWVRRVDRATWRELRRGLIPLVAAFLVVGAPMLLTAATDPVGYFGRAAMVSPLNPGVQSDSSLPIHWLRTLGMFAVVGDPNARHDVDALPLLGWPLTVAAAVGCLRLWRLRRDPGHALILLALPVFLLAPLLAVEGESPHFLRALGLAAPLGVAIGLGVESLVGEARRRRGATGARGATAITSIVLLALAAASGQAYLSRPAADRYDAYSYDLTAMAAVAGAAHGSAVILDDYAATAVRFLDAADPPAVLAPGTRVADPAAYRAVFACSRAALASALGPAAAASASIVARDPVGRPRVWAASP